MRLCKQGTPSYKNSQKLWQEAALTLTYFAKELIKTQYVRVYVYMYACVCVCNF